MKNGKGTYYTKLKNEHNLSVTSEKELSKQGELLTQMYQQLSGR